MNPEQLRLFNATMERLADVFKELIQDEILKPRPFSPGYRNNRAPFGVSPKVASGTLVNSVNVDWFVDSQTLEVSMVDYWKYVNDGRKPGKYVPIAPLIKWINTKRFRTKARDEKGRFKKFDAKSMAFGISKNIYKFGIARTNFYDDAYGKFQTYLDEAINDLGDDFGNYLTNIIEKDL